MSVIAGLTYRLVIHSFSEGGSFNEGGTGCKRNIEGVPACRQAGFEKRE